MGNFHNGNAITQNGWGVNEVVPVVAKMLFFTRSELEGKEYFRGSEACFELSRTALLRRSAVELLSF